MDKKNHYRIVLNAVLRLPWGEGLGRGIVIDNNGHVCAVGAALVGSHPQHERNDAWVELPKNSKLDKFTDACRDIMVINDAFVEELPLDRKHRMIKWLRERADAVDAAVANSKQPGDGHE